MIALRHDTNYFDLDERASITLEADSPAFVNDAIPGLRVYSFNLPNSRNNRGLLSYADQLNRRDAFRVLDDVNLELMGLHFRKGKLQIEQSDSKAFAVSFIADTGDVAATLKETRLRALDMGTASVNTSPNIASYPGDKHCFFTVKNPIFYGDTNSDYIGYVNYFDNNNFKSNTTINEHTLTPFVFVRSVLDAIAQLIGYRQQGDWLDKIDQLCIYSNIALDALNGSGLNIYQSNFNPADHLPDMSCGAFLQAIRSLFGLMINFDSTKKTMEFVPLTELVSNTNYLKMDHAAVKEHSLEPYPLDGYELRMGIDSSDELYKRKTIRSTYYELGRKEKKISSQAGTLYMLTEPDPRNPGQVWTIPQVEQPGTSAEFDIENEAGLRLLWYHANPSDYYQGSPYDDDYDLSYHLGDPNNLYTRGWQPWLEHVAQPSVQTSLNWRLPDLLSINFGRKLLIKGNAFLLEKYSLPVSRNGLGTAKVKLRRVKY